MILAAWGRPEEAVALLKRQEALCLELDNQSRLASCYWNWGLVARKQCDRKTEREKLSAALDIFSELNMPRERATQCVRNWRRRQQLTEPPKKPQILSVRRGKNQGRGEG